MFPVKEMMTKDVITVTKETPIFDAARLLVEKKITGIPVVDQEKNLIGILSEFDVLRLLTECSSEKAGTVEDYMTKKVVFFEDSASATEICEFFLTNPSKRRVPITRDGKLVGLVSRGDIVKLIVKFRQNRMGPKA